MQAIRFKLLSSAKLPTRKFFSSSEHASHGHGVKNIAEEEEHFFAHAVESASYWKKVSFVAIVATTLTSAYILTSGGDEPHQAVQFPYMRIRSKQFPWGDYNWLYPLEHHDKHDEGKEHSEHSEH